MMLAAFLAVGVLFVVREFNDVTRKARPDDQREELAPPVYLSVVQVALAARLGRWEQRTGRTLLLRPKFRWIGGWTAADNFSFR